MWDKIYFIFYWIVFVAVILIVVGSMWIIFDGVMEGVR